LATPRHIGSVPYKTQTITSAMADSFHHMLGTLDRVIYALQSSAHKQESTIEQLREYIEMIRDLKENKDIILEFTRVPADEVRLTETFNLRRRYPTADNDNHIVIELQDHFKCRCYATKSGSEIYLGEFDLVDDNGDIIDAKFVDVIKTLHLPSEQPKTCCIS
jgi:hypothetical protein